MSFELHKVGKHYEFKGTDPHVQSLPMAPTGIEQELGNGIWLVAMLAVWSGPDLDALGTVIELGKKFAGKLKAAIRPFDEHSEIRAWCPDCSEECGSPVWLLLADGKLRAQRTGVWTSGDMETWIVRSLA